MRPTASDLSEKRRLHEEGKRRCAECDVLLPLSEFGRHSKDPMGLQPRCRPCTNERNRARHAAKREGLPRRPRRLTVEEAWAEVLHDRGMRWCAPCERVLPEADFGPLASGKYGLTPACRECTRRRWRDWMGQTPEAQERRREENRRRNTPERTRRYNLKKMYGLTVEEYEALLTEQGGGCAICGRIGTIKRGEKSLPMYVDHCHDTGKVRGLLCHNCNHGLGHFFDDPDRLTKAARYIRRSRC